MSQAAADELQRRLVSFTVKIIELARHLPKTPAGRHVSSQILRSGTSPLLSKISMRQVAAHHSGSSDGSSRLG
jgi:hypothetical protein